MKNNGKQWYALYTSPRAEKKVAAALESGGYEVYLPLQTTIKQWSDRKKKVEEPLFKSYIFIHTEIEKHYYPILGIKGVVKFVKTGSELSPVRSGVIDAIKLSLLHFDQIELSSVNFGVNEKVVVVAGPLKGFEGTVVKQHGSQYFAIHIEQIGTHMLLKIPAAYLQKA